MSRLTKYDVDIQIEAAFKKYLEFSGSTLYIKANGQETVTTLDQLFNWFEDNKYDLPDRKKIASLRDELNALYEHLGIVYTITPERKHFVQRILKKAKK